MDSELVRLCFLHFFVGQLHSQKLVTTYVSGDYGDLNLYSRVMSEPPPPPGLARPTSPWCVFSQFSLFGVFTVRFLLYFNMACS